MSKAISLIKSYGGLPSPLGDLNAYVAAVNSIPNLSADEERELGEDWAYRKNQDAAYRLVVAHLKLVVKIARQYAGYGLQLADLVQEGNIGLMKAVKRFEPSHGARLGTFALQWIHSEISEFIIRNWKIVKSITTKAHRKLFFNLRKLRESTNHLTTDEARAISERLDVPLRDVYMVEGQFIGRDDGFDGYSIDDRQESRSLYPCEYLHSESDDPARVVESVDYEESRTASVEAALAALDARTADIISSRWLAEEKSSLADLAAKYGVSIERIRQLESNGLKKMRAALDDGESD